MEMNLPNKLTVLRVVLIPVFLAALFFAPEPMNRYGAVLIFVIASLTDLLDGKIARKYHLETDFGKFADPLADKMLTTAAFIYMMMDGVCSPVVLAVTVFREFAVAGIRMVAAAGNKVIAANMWGKVKTVLQMFAIALLLLHNWPFALIGLPVAQTLLWAACAASLYSGWIYFEKLKKYVLESM